MHRFAGACGALGNRIRVWPSLVAALASFSSAPVATARTTFTARELVPVGVGAAKITLGLASIATALPSSTCEWKAINVVACFDEILVEPFRDVDVLLDISQAQHGALLARAFAI